MLDKGSVESTFENVFRAAARAVDRSVGDGEPGVEDIEAVGDGGVSRAGVGQDGKNADFVQAAVGSSVIDGFLIFQVSVGHAHSHITLTTTEEHVTK